MWRSCVPQPISEGWQMPSEWKPLTDHVFSKRPTFFGYFDTCESYSAMCTVFTPRSCMSLPHSSRDCGFFVECPTAFAMLSRATFTKCDTMPGFAPWHETAVEPPGDVRLRSSRVSRRPKLDFCETDSDGSGY